jgi:hypothetical protein
MNLDNLGQRLVYESKELRELTRKLIIRVRQRQARDVFTLLLLAAVAGGLAWALDLPHFCYGLVAAGLGAGIADLFPN